MKYKLIIFDMDGTILDTLEDLYSSLNYVLNEFGYPMRTMDEVRSFVGNGIKKLVERSIPDGTSREAAENFLNVFSNHYRAHCFEHTRPYEGIVSLLIELKNAGCHIAVVSNKDDYAVKLLCERYFSGLFEMAVGNRAGIRKKPAPDSVNEVLSALGVAVQNAVYVGDSEVDIKTAENAGMSCISVLWGFRNMKQLNDSGVKISKTAKNISELKKLIF